jgi:small subunit ribosomal protein S9
METSPSPDSRLYQFCSKKEFTSLTTKEFIKRAHHQNHKRERTKTKRTNRMHRNRATRSLLSLCSTSSETFQRTESTLCTALFSTLRLSRSKNERGRMKSSSKTSTDPFRDMLRNNVRCYISSNSLTTTTTIERSMKENECLFKKRVSTNTKTRRMTAEELIQKIKKTIQVQSEEDIPEDRPFGTAKKVRKDIPDGVLYGSMNDPTPGRHLLKQSEEEVEILESLDSVFNGEFADGDLLPPLEHFYQDVNVLEKEARQEREKRKQLEQKEFRVKKIDVYGGASATGKRKTAVAQVRIKPALSEESAGEIEVNGIPMDEYFAQTSLRQHVLAPFAATRTLGLFDMKVFVNGGGLSGQSQACRLGVARCLQNFDPSFRPALKQMGFLTRDSRVVERKKPGLKKARKAFQWVKR